MTDPVRRRKPTRAFFLSFIGGILIVVADGARIVIMALHFSSVMPNVVAPAYAMLQAAGLAGGALSYLLAIIAVISGVFVIIGALMIHYRPAKAATWANLILAFSFLSFAGSGGFFIGAVLGIIGGAFALIQRPNPKHPPMKKARVV